MAELVALDRSGGWRKRLREQEEVAVGVMGPLPRRQGPANPLADWLEGNRNGLEPTIKSLYEQDMDNIKILLSSGMVDLNELLLYHTPELLLNQGEKIDPANGRITGRVNDMARSRRALLRMKLKKKINAAECRKISNDLSKWPVEVQELQGCVSDLKGRYVRIPPILVSKVNLLS